MHNHEPESPVQGKGGSIRSVIPHASGAQSLTLER